MAFLAQKLKILKLHFQIFLNFYVSLGLMICTKICAFNVGLCPLLLLVFTKKCGAQFYIIGYLVGSLLCICIHFDIYFTGFFRFTVIMTKFFTLKHL
jgi:hypothetical protein